MAICGFRADNVSFGLLEGEGMGKVVDLLEEAAGKDPREEKEARATWGPLVDAFLRSGLLASEGGRIVLAPRGRALLEGLRRLRGTSPLGGC